MWESRSSEKGEDLRSMGRHYTHSVPSVLQCSYDCLLILQMAFNQFSLYKGEKVARLPVGPLIYSEKKGWFYSLEVFQIWRKSVWQKRRVKQDLRLFRHLSFWRKAKWQALSLQPITSVPTSPRNNRHIAVRKIQLIYFLSLSFTLSFSLTLTHALYRNKQTNKKKTSKSNKKTRIRTCSKNVQLLLLLFFLLLGQKHNGQLYFRSQILAMSLLRRNSAHLLMS